MTISSTARRAGPFLGNDSATAFAFSFKVFSTSDITVTTADSAAVETTLVLDTDYTVTLNPNQDTSPGGVVTYPISGSALPTGSRLTITGNLPYDQPLDIPAGGNFNPVTIENEFDRIVMQVQQLREVADRSITASVTSSVSGELPVPQAGRLLGWDQSNTAIVNYSIEELTGTAAYATWVYDTFTGNGIKRVYALQKSPGNIANCDVSVDGQTLVPITDFTLSGSNLTFVTAPRSGAEILVRYGSAAPQGTYAIETERKVATAGQTVVTLTEVTYVPGANNISVYLNGARMSAGIDFTETSSTSITFENALSLNDEIVCVVGNEVSQAVSAQQVGYFTAGTGAVSRDVRSVLRERVSVKDFGAVGDGVADDTAAIQAAVSALPATGGMLYFPTGSYRVSSAITLNKPGIYCGDGWATNIVSSSATANTFLVSGAEQIHIAQMRFTASVTKTAGWYVDVAASANRFRISDFAMDGAIGGIRTAAVATSTIERGQILNCVAGTGIPIRIDAGFDVTVRDIISDQASQTFAGIYITNSGDITLEDLQLIRCGQALYVKADAGKVIASLWANNCFFDNSTRGAYLQASGGSIVRSLFDQCWFSSATYEGVRLESSGGGSINGTDFNGCHVFLNGGDGISVIDSGVTNTRIHDCVIAGNSSNGVSLATDVSDASIQDSRIGAAHGISGNALSGIGIVAGTGNNIQILNNDLRGNITANLSNSASGANIIIANNLGAEESWTSYTPTVTTGTGSITTLGAVGARYQKIGKKLFIAISIPITTNGTGATDVKVTLPTGISAATDCVLAGRENSVTGNQLQAVILATSGQMSITKYDNSYPGGNGYRLLVTGMIEVQ